MIERLRPALVRLLRLWRGSLTIRVTAVSLSLSLVIAGSVSFVALTKVRDGLVDSRVEWAQSKAADGVQSAIRVASSIPEPTSQGERVALVESIVSAVAEPAGASGDFEVLLLAGPGQSLLTAPERGTNQISTASISQELRTLIEVEQAQAWQIAELRFVDGHVEPGVVVGSPLLLPGIGRYELFQLYPLTSEIASLDLARQALGLAGLLMVISLVLVSLVLARQVALPVRRVAESAERLREGRLTERLPVRGQDDLARLALSFNGMASSLQEQIRRLEELSRVQQRFVSDVSHELRTPLTTIRMGADLIQGASDDFDPTTRKAAELLQSESERFEALLNDLLEISRYDAGSVRIDPASVDLTAVVARVVLSLESIAEQRGVALQVHKPAELGVVSCDIRRIERVIRNLISNAIEHAEGQPVQVVVAGNAEAVAICVRDFGAGLKPGETALVFNRFWRADPSRQRTLGGSGLGLAISLEDARLHGGWLEADGTPGAGANFRLVLPRQVGELVVEPPLPLALDEIDAWLGEHHG